MRRRDFFSFIGGAMVAMPGIARAQPAGKIPTVGYLWHAGNAKEETPYFEALLEGFAKLGYVEGRNIKLEHRFPNETPERFKSMAAELVSLNVDVLMGGAIASTYLRDATTKIPIVFMFVPDPVGMKFVQSIARPGGNITGLSNFGRDVAGKRLQLLKEIVPGLSRVALLINSQQATTRVFVEVMQPVCRRLRPSKEDSSFRRERSLPNWPSRVVCRCWLIRGRRLSTARWSPMQLTKSKCVVDRLFTPTKS